LPDGSGEHTGILQDDLTPDEDEDLHKAMNLIDRMLAGK
jgi:hypothetical protein